MENLLPAEQGRHHGIKACVVDHGCGPQRHIWAEWDFWDEGLYGEIVRIYGGT